MSRFHFLGSPMLTQRRSGILLHPTSLSGLQAVGSLGQEAYDFIDFLVAAQQSVWQILPLGPTGFGNCPYSCFSAFAGNPLLINLELLVEVGDLNNFDLPKTTSPDSSADFGKATATILPALFAACENFKLNHTSPRQHNFNTFCDNQSHWLDDYSLYEAIRESLDYSPWQQWPEDIRLRRKEALQRWQNKLQDETYQHKYKQFVFFEQWLRLKSYGNKKGVEIFGDLPIFVAADSADVWANQELFYLDDNNQATIVAGVPPDYFSPTGQRWGNPLYRWEQMAADNFSWWLDRFRWNFELFDLLRVDHFRGFSACWAIPATEPTAVNGYWMEAQGEKLFNLLKHELGSLPIIAEDLGIITSDVEQLRDKFAFPGMKILHFAFDSGSDNPYLPHNHILNSVIYTGTHDNDTSLGWWDALSTEEQQRVSDYLQIKCDDMPWDLIAVAMASAANLAIFPMQDILSLPTASRMNIPGTAEGNWQWQMQTNALSAQLFERLKELSQLNNRNLCIPA